MRKIDYIVIHCSATPPSMDIGWTDIDHWHRLKGWLMGGYHYIIRRDGTVEEGRPVTMNGAHVYPPAGVNRRSVGICMVGGVKERDKKTPEDNFTDEQYLALDSLVSQLEHKFPEARVFGHNYWSPSRGCPSFDWAAWADARSEKPINVRPILMLGDKGRYVEMMQKLIGGLTVDGLFGHVTEQRVMDFQEDNALQVDGVVGPDTWKVIDELYLGGNSE